MDREIVILRLPFRGVEIDDRRIDWRSKGCKPKDQAQKIWTQE